MKKIKKLQDELKREKKFNKYLTEQVLRLEKLTKAQADIIFHLI